MHKIASRILDVFYDFQNMNVQINEKSCVRPPPYYLELLESSYPSFPISWDESPFFKCINGIKGIKPPGRQWNRLLYAVVKIAK